MQQHEIPLERGKVYHVYNRGINGSIIFNEPTNYLFFLKQYAKHLSDYVDTYAYCLMTNHYHILLRVKEDLPNYIGDHPSGVHSIDRMVSKQFGKLFSSYTQAFNKVSVRTGPLLESPFKRKSVESEEYFTTLLYYIHANSQLHGVIDNFRLYEHSSYQSHLAINKQTRLSRDYVLNWFGGTQAYIDAHAMSYDFTCIKELFLD